MTTPTVRLSSPAALAASVPSLLGFEPAAGSAVIVALSNGRVGLTLRLDLPSPDHDPAAAALLAGAIRRGHPGVDQVCLIGWGIETARTESLYAALADQGLSVGTCLTVQGDVVLDSTEDHPRWVPLPPDAVRPAAILTNGLVVRKSREALAELVDYSGEELTEARADVASQLGTPPERDRLILGLAETEGEDLAAELESYASIARAYPAGDLRRDGALCLTALAAWLTGDGALAAVALERCSPGYNLARLLTAALSATVSPTELRALIRRAGDALV